MSHSNSNTSHKNWSNALQLNTKNINGLTDEERLETIASYFCVLATSPCGTQGCDCLRYLSDEDDDRNAASKAVLAFSKLPKPTQQLLLIEKIQSSKLVAKVVGRAKKAYSIPGINGTHHPVCEQAMMKLFRYGKFAFGGLKKHANHGTQPVHGLSNKRGNKSKSFDVKVTPRLKHFFETTVLPLSGPRPTRFVREELAGEILNAERDVDNTLELDPEWSKRRLYAQLVYNHGMVVVKTSMRGRITFKAREDDEWVEGGESSEVLCAWSSFLTYWKMNHPNLLVRKPSQDICGLCYEFHMNRTQRSLASNTQSDPYTCSTGDDDDVDAAEEEMIDEEEKISSGWNDIADQQEIKLLEVAQHIHEAKLMRLMANAAMERAKQCKEDGVDDKDTELCFVADYAQNLSLPYFGSTQPGETYYYTPKTVPLFGVVDCAPRDEVLHAYMYEEDDGGKGGNHVASLLMQHLSDQGYLVKDNPKKKLTIIMDNCSGQNKNRMVLRLPPLLIDMGYFDEVVFLFLVVGHTKNAADRLFNITKMLYRKTNVFCMDQLAKNLDHKQVVWHIVTWESFFDYASYLSTFFVPAMKKGVKKWQVFRSATSVGLGMIEMWTSNLPDKLVASESLYKKKISVARRKELMSSEVPPLYSTRPGLKEIKQCELYLKYRPLVPPEYREILCPKPADEVLQRDKRRRQVKAAETRTKKKAAATTGK